MSTLMLRSGLAGMLLVAITVCNASAQCNTCATPTVAYAPVVAQPTVAYRPYTGWYPGKLIDQWRLRRAAKAAPVYTAAYAPTYSAAYAPSYTTSYAPSYTASYAPTYTTAYAPTYTTAYRPYLTAYAPLAAPASACNTCTQTVARQVVMQPVVASACSACSYTPSCSCGGCGCDACSSGVSQAAYVEAPGCSSCAAGAPASVMPPAAASQPSAGPATTQPSYAPVPAPADSQYRQKPATDSNDIDPLDEYDPGPINETESDSSTWYNAPRLLDPRDRTATRTYKSRKPTVDIWTAVYRDDASNGTASKTSVRTSNQPARTQAEIDADGWSAVN